MKVIYALEAIPDSGDDGSIFLAGPTPRSKDVPSWRPRALEILEKLKFKGIVFVPERRKVVQAEYEDQIEWEWAGLDSCGSVGAIAVWVPRDLETMPAFTTNVEFGYYLHTHNLWYGRPFGAPKTRYLDALYQRETGETPFDNLDKLLKACVKESVRDSGKII